MINILDQKIWNTVYQLDRNKTNISEIINNNPILNKELVVKYWLITRDQGVVWNNILLDNDKEILKLIQENSTLFDNRKEKLNQILQQFEEQKERKEIKVVSTKMDCSEMSVEILV